MASFLIYCVAYRRFIYFACVIREKRAEHVYIIKSSGMFSNKFEEVCFLKKLCLELLWDRVY